MPVIISEKLYQKLIWLTLFLLFISIIKIFGPILTPFFSAIILAYVLNPGVDWLTKQRFISIQLPRVIAVLIIILLLLLSLLALILIVIPIVVKELPLLQLQIPTFLDTLNTKLAPRLHDFGIHSRLDVPGIKKFLTQRFISGNDAILTSVLSSVKIGGTAIIVWLTNILLIPIVLFYLLQDWHMFVTNLLRIIPRRMIVQISNVSKEVDNLLAQYLRGQLLVMFILAIYYSVTLTMAGFDIALPIGILTGLLVFIPYIGFGLCLLLAIIAATFQFNGLYGLILVAIIYGIGQILESFILTPQLVGERIGLHPLIVIFSLLAFGQLFGFIGVLLALPTSAIISILTRHLYFYYLKSNFYKK